MGNLILFGPVHNQVVDPFLPPAALVRPVGQAHEVGGGLIVPDLAIGFGNRVGVPGNQIEPHGEIVKHGHAVSVRRDGPHGGVIPL